MQNFFTREDVLAYHQQGVQTIRLDSMPILTDLARETLQTLGMEIVTGAAPAAQPASRHAASTPAAAPSGGGSAANWFGTKGFPSLLVGVGMTDFHTNRESLKVKDLYEAGDLVYHIIEAESHFAGH